jgi:hypothetical protein
MRARYAGPYLLALAALAHTGTAQRRTNDEPRPGIYRAGDGEWRLDLPTAMEDALDRASRGFDPWTAQDYRPSEVEGYSPSPRQTPWAVIGDFNGDGRMDVAVAGRDDRDALVLIVLSTGQKRYRAIRADAEPYDPDEPRSVRPPVLSYVYPGKYVIDDPRLRRARELLVDQPAVQSVGGRRSGAVLYNIENNAVVPYYLSVAPADPPRRPRPPRPKRSTTTAEDSVSPSHSR